MSIKFARIAFIDGDEGARIVDAILTAQGVDRRTAGLAMGEALADTYDEGEYHDVHDEPARGTFDTVVAFGPYYLTYHQGLHYVGLERAVDDDATDIPAWCGRCGEWIDYCMGHGEGDTSEDYMEFLVDTFKVMLTEGAN